MLEYDIYPQHFIRLASSTSDEGSEALEWGWTEKMEHFNMIDILP